MALRRFKIILEPEAEGGYSVYVPSLPGCTTQGETPEECLRNAREAINLFIQSLLDDNLSLPESDVLLEEIEVKV